MNTNTKIALGVVGGLMVGCILFSPTEQQMVSEEPQQTEQVVEQQEVASQDVSEEQVDESIYYDPLVVEGDDFTIEITDLKTKGDDLIIEYTFNNESEESQTPIWSVSFTGYQDGVELSQSYKGGNYKHQKSILPGYSSEGLEKRIEVDNDSDPIILKVTPWVDFADTVYAEFEVDLQALDLVRIN